jgi:hypothetical protein
MCLFELNTLEIKFINLNCVLFKFIKFLLKALVKELQLVLGDNKLFSAKAPWKVDPLTLNYSILIFKDI